MTRSRIALVLAGAMALAPFSAAAPLHAAPATQVGVTATSPAAVSVTTSGELAVGKTLAAAVQGLPVDSAVAYQWLANGAPVAGATGSTLTLTTAHAGRVVEVRVTVTSTDGTTVTSTSARRLKVATAPSPTLSGSSVEGATLTATAGTWTAGTALTYQWLADGVPITGATSRTYVIPSSMSGKRLAVRVTGSLAGYQTLARTALTPSQRVMVWTTPTVTGTLAVGSTLTANRGSWTSGTTFSYQWYADGSAISGATGSTFRLTSAQAGKGISVRVTGSQSGYPTVRRTSATTQRVTTAPTPAIGGTPVAGTQLRASAGSWTPYSTLSYQWLADGVAIPGATSSSFTVTSTQRDKQIRVRVTGRRSGYATVVRTSSATLRVQTAPRPSISGSPKVTYTLTANRGTWSTGTTFTYQWYASGSAISGATGSTLKLGSSLRGKTITVKVTGRKSGYPTASRTSAATAAVTYPASTPPISTYDCPSWAPIKGNASSMIYHVPGGAYYARTTPEECFVSEAAAVAAGYRRSKL